MGWDEHASCVLNLLLGLILSLNQLCRASILSSQLDAAVLAERYSEAAKCKEQMEESHARNFAEIAQLVRVYVFYLHASCIAFLLLSPLWVMVTASVM